LKYEGIKAHNIKLLDDWTQDDDDAELNNRYNDVLNPMTNGKMLRRSERHKFYINYEISKDIFSGLENKGTLLLKNKIFSDKKSYTQNLYNYYKKNKNLETFYDFLRFHGECMSKFIKIYNKYLPSIKNYIRFSKQSTNLDKIVLYRGIRYLNNTDDTVFNIVKNVSNGDTILFRHILSSNIYFNTATRFTSGNNIEDRIIIKINIPKKKFDKFKFSYISEDIIVNNIIII